MKIIHISQNETMIIAHRTDETNYNGVRTIFKCSQCGSEFSQTKLTFISVLKKPMSLIAQVFKARTEGMGLNAVCRVFSLAKNTVLNWERKLSGLKETFLLYALLQSFMSQEIEGDELYTKVNQNLPVEDCEGWTIVLMDRASRFIWDLECGKRDRALFIKAMERLKEVINQTEDLSLLTEGERRYGNLLFEICHELVKSGKRGRPPKVLPEGVKVRVKNKGNPNHKPKSKRAKYPETVQNLDDKDIHANHVEALNASLRRRLAPYRRKTNRYAKQTTHLQRV